MNEKIVSMLCELMRDGGSTAVWMWCLYLGVGLIKWLIGAGIIYYLSTRGIKILLNWFKLITIEENNRQARHNDEMEQWRNKTQQNKEE